MRVSVVATGIDQSATFVERSGEDTIAALTERLRARKAQPQIAVQPSVAAQSPAPAPAAAPAAAAAAAAEAAVETALRAPAEPAPAPAEPAPAPVAASDPGVHISRMEPPAVPQMPAAEAPAETNDGAEYEGAFVPPTASHPDRRPPRMPQIEDFPLIAQNEMRARTGAGPQAGQPGGQTHAPQAGQAAGSHAAPQAGHEERRRPGLLQRIASVGLGRRDDADDSDVIEPPAVAGYHGEEPVSEYARRPQRPAQPEQPKHAPQVANAPRRGPSIDDDQYEIPAFLRRQAN